MGLFHDYGHITFITPLGYPLGTPYYPPLLQFISSPFPCFVPKTWAESRWTWSIKQCSQLVPSMSIHPSKWNADTRSNYFHATLIFILVPSFLPCCHRVTLVSPCIVFSPPLVTILGAFMVPCGSIVSLLMFTTLPLWLLFLWVVWVVIWNYLSYWLFGLWLLNMWFL